MLTRLAAAPPEPSETAALKLHGPLKVTPAELPTILLVVVLATVTELVMVMAEVPSATSAPPVPTLCKVIAPVPKAEPLLKFKVPENGTVE